MKFVKDFEPLLEAISGESECAGAQKHVIPCNLPLCSNGGMPPSPIPKLFITSREAFQA